MVIFFIKVAQCCTYPFDLVRRRLQALHKPDHMTEAERVRLPSCQENMSNLVVKVTCTSNACSLLIYLLTVNPSVSYKYEFATRVTTGFSEVCDHLQSILLVLDNERHFIHCKNRRFTRFISRRFAQLSEDRTGNVNKFYLLRQNPQRIRRSTW